MFVTYQDQILPWQVCGWNFQWFHVSIADMTPLLESSQFPLVEMVCTTSALICWCMMVNWAGSTSEWMEWFCAQLVETTATMVLMFMHRPRAAVSFSSQKVGAHSIPCQLETLNSSFWMFPLHVVKLFLHCVKGRFGEKIQSCFWVLHIFLSMNVTKSTMHWLFSDLQSADVVLDARVTALEENGNENNTGKFWHHNWKSNQWKERKAQDRVKSEEQSHVLTVGIQEQKGPTSHQLCKFASSYFAENHTSLCLFGFRHCGFLCCVSKSKHYPAGHQCFVQWSSFQQQRWVCQVWCWCFFR